MANRSRRILQAAAILFMCFIALVIIDKGITDISVFMHNNPDDFWRALAKYLIGNLAGGDDS